VPRQIQEIVHFNNHLAICQNINNLILAYKRCCRRISKIFIDAVFLQAFIIMLQCNGYDAEKYHTQRELSF